MTDKNERGITLVHHICPAAAWRRAVETGTYGGGPQDQADGFIHFSATAQLADSAARYWHGTDSLVVVSVDAARLGDALRWEVSRGGALFPHLYGELAVDQVWRVDELAMTDDGGHVLPSF